MTLAVVIPAYNAAAHLLSVLARIEALSDIGLSHVIVVNDGSTDETASRARSASFQRCPLTLLDRPQNGGYGAAMKDGLLAAVDGGAEYVACIHADGQYSPEALPTLLAAIRERGLDLVQGSRIASGTAIAGGMPLSKYVGNMVLNVLENRALKLSLSDYHSGYLLYGPRTRSLPFRSFSNSFDFDLEVIACASARGLRVGEAPVPTHYGDEVSHLNPLTYVPRVLRVLWNFHSGRYAEALP